MARVQVPITVLDTTGAPIPGASVRVQQRAGGADATLYSGESGGSTTTNPTATDSAGRVQAWVDRGAYNAVISGTGFTTYTQPFDAAAAADSAIDGLWIPDSGIARAKLGVDPRWATTGFIAGPTYPGGSNTTVQTLSITTRGGPIVIGATGMLSNDGVGTNTYTIVLGVRVDGGTAHHLLFAQSLGGSAIKENLAGSVVVAVTAGAHTVDLRCTSLSSSSGAASPSWGLYDYSFSVHEIF